MRIKKKKKKKMKNIRHSLFETNSSSMHSVVILDHKENDKDEYYSAKEILQSLKPYKINKYYDDGSYIKSHYYVYFFDDNSLYFGRRPFNILSSFGDKLRFVMAAYLPQYHQSDNPISDMRNLIMFDKSVKMFQDIIKSGLKRQMKNTKEMVINIKFLFDICINKYCGQCDVTMNYYKRELECDDETIKKLSYKLDLEGGCADDADMLNFFEKRPSVTFEEFLLNKKYIIIQDGDEYCTWKHFKRSKLIDTNKIIEEIRL